MNNIFMVTVLASFFAAAPVVAGSLPYSEVVSGSALMLTSGTINIDDRAIKLAGIRDIDDPASDCTWHPRYLNRNEMNLPPSINTSENRSLCARPADTIRSTRDRYKKGACQIAMTAVDQGDALKKLIAGREISCKVASSQTMKALWEAGKYVSRHGYKVSPGNCTVDGKSLNMALLQTGLAAYTRAEGKLFADSEDATRARFFKEQIELSKKTQSGFVSTRSNCRKTNYADFWPDRYNPKPNFP